MNRDGLDKAMGISIRTIICKKHPALRRQGVIQLNVQ